jgi:hypothetical protein
MVGSLDEATEIAKQHPGLEYGLVIEVRQLTDTCHLGVNVRKDAARPLAAI